jgi:hypothetical protein
LYLQNTTMLQNKLRIHRLLTHESLVLRFATASVYNIFAYQRPIMAEFTLVTVKAHSAANKIWHKTWGVHDSYNSYNSLWRHVEYHRMLSKFWRNINTGSTIRVKVKIQVVYSSEMLAPTYQTMIHCYNHKDPNVIITLIHKIPCTLSLAFNYFDEQYLQQR